MQNTVLKKVHIQLPITSEALKGPNPNFNCLFMDILRVLSESLVVIQVRREKLQLSFLMILLLQNKLVGKSELGIGDS